MAFKLALFDLDGTLLNKARTVHEANRAAIRRAMASGLKVGFATGRTRLSVAPYLAEVSPNGPLILFNGARVWDQSEARYIHEKNLNRDDSLLILEMAKERPIHVNLYLGDQVIISARTPVSEESERKDGVGHTVVGDLRSHLASRSETPIKIMLIAEPPELRAIGEEFRKRSSGDCALVRSERTYLEFLPGGVNKGSALQAVEKHYGISSDEVIAFGDNLNDLELLSRAGLGIAMENAHPELQRAAKRVIGHHETDAIAKLLAEVL